MTARGLIIAGTDTDVGKTYATAAIVAWLRREGVDAVPLKPIQTGADPDSTVGSSGWHAPDLDFVLAAAGLAVGPEAYADMAPSCYRTAASPHLAARKESRPVDRAAIAGATARLAAAHDVVVVEGAGGLLVPLDDDGTMMVDLLADIGRERDWSVLLVGRAGLGTINHTLLSLAALERHGLAVAGSLLVATGHAMTPDWLVADNIATIHRLGSAPCFGLLGWIDAGQADAFSRAVDEVPALVDFLRAGLHAPDPQPDDNREFPG